MGILKNDGRPDTGMAYKIAYDGHEPAGREVRLRLGLRDICTKCHRGFRKRMVRKMTPARAWWETLETSKREKIIQSLYLLRDVKDL
jgi:hypothetical protein